MYKLVRDSFLNTKEIINYRKDKVIKALFYLLFMSVLASLVNILLITKINGLDYEMKNDLKTKLSQIDTSCYVEDAYLQCSDEDILVFKNVGDSLVDIVLYPKEEIDLSDFTKMRYSLVFHKDKYYLVMSSTELAKGNINELPKEFHNLDFSKMAEKDEDFFNQLFLGIDEFIVNTKPLWGTIFIAGQIFLEFLLFLFIVLLNAFIIRKRAKHFKFRDLFVMMTYGSTAIYIVQIFNSFHIFTTFIYLLLILLAFRQVSKLHFEIFKMNEKLKN